MARINKIATLIVLTLYVCSVFLPDAGHDEAISGRIGAVPQFTTHDCGAHERHKPIDPNHICQACFRQANSTANTTPASLSFTVGAVSPELVPSIEARPTGSSDYYVSAAKRGPPPSIPQS